ncbi:MAG: FMN phosphatase YigB (HAD superfamily) [Pseudohongiellaceae bacterium]|jgi:FMN phosphatase YigB (HAD superfamily)
MMEIQSMLKVADHVSSNRVIKIISIDFFDTLASRILDEKALIKISAKRFFENNNKILDIEKFLVEKEKSEVELRSKSLSLGRDKEASNSTIYGLVFNRYFEEECKDTPREFCDFLSSMEADNLVLNSDVYELLAGLDKGTWRVIITSDTYYSTQDFKSFLEILNIANFIDQVYLSAERGFNKASGKMFELIANEQGVDYQEILHVGDNPFSDCLKPSKLGISTLHYKPSAEAVRKLPLNHFGGSILAPVLLSFVAGLIKTESKNNESHFFLGRDAYLLNKIYDLLKDAESEKYLYINRCLANQIFYESLNAEVCTYVGVENKAEGVWGLVTCLGLNDSDFSKAFEEFITTMRWSKNGLLDENKVIEILNNTYLKEKFNHSIKERKSYVLQYLESAFKPYKDKNLVFVDIGWRGDIAKKLSILDITRHQLFCYIGDRKDHVSGYVNNTSNEALLAVLNDNRELLEYCCSEDKPPISYINNELKPVFKKEIITRISEAKNLIQQAVLEACKYYKNSFIGLNSEHSYLNELQDYMQNIPEGLIKSLSDESGEVSLSGNNLPFKYLLNNQNMNKGSVSEMKNTQALLYSFLEFVKKINLSEGVVLYGAGSGAEFIIPHIIRKSRFIVDLDERLHDEEVAAVKVKPISSLSDISMPVVVTVLGRRQQIQALLQPYQLEVLFMEDYL